MPNEINAASAAAGSAIANGPTNPNTLGQPSNSGNNMDYKDLYEGLERKFGSQGRELGDLRVFFDGITPLLKVLDQSPELVQGILDGRIDTNLAKAVSEGKVSISDAEAISQAQAEVKKEMGSKEYNKTSSEDIARIIEEKVDGVRQELKEVEEARNFETSVNDFISRTPDFADYAKEINEWLDEHDVTDLSVAYYAVKGQVSEREAKKMAEANEGEMSKNLAMNAGGGGSRTTYIPESSNMVDQLIAGKSNPNVF